MLRILLGLLYALLVSVGFSVLFSLVICCGADPEARIVSDGASPLLGIFTGAWLASRGTSWRMGLWIGLWSVAAWILFWMYIMGRWNPVMWVEEGLPHLTSGHLFWWGLAIVLGLAGGSARSVRPTKFLTILIVAFLGVTALMFYKSSVTGSLGNEEPLTSGFQLERMGAKADQTVVYSMSFDFEKQKGFRVGVYDCDSDDAQPCDDSNTTYLGQDLEKLAFKLDQRAAVAHRQLLCVINGGFFGASGFAVAHHEEPMVEDGTAFYNVDLLRPKEQGWFFAVNSPTSILSGQPRFLMLPSIPWHDLEKYQTVLGGVRPLRVDGRSLALKPGAGATTLKCSRTSVGWSADGKKFYVLIVYDPQSEAASQVQRKMHWAHAGGWDVGDIQKYWEQKGVPFALLFDGGESTQLAYRRSDGRYHEVYSGYQYSYTVGYLFQRPVSLTLPIFPPSAGHRGVLNYLYLDGSGRG